MQIPTTKQEYYDWLAQSAKDGTFPGAKIGDNGVCLLRANQKADCPQRCALGGLIPDELYEPWMEISSIYAVVTGRFKDRLKIPAGMSIPDLYAVQSVHDLAVYSWSGEWFPRKFMTELNQLACFQDVGQYNPANYPERVEVKSGE